MPACRTKIICNSSSSISAGAISEGGRGSLPATSVLSNSLARMPHKSQTPTGNTMIFDRGVPDWARLYVEPHPANSKYLIHLNTNP